MRAILYDSPGPATNLYLGESRQPTLMDDAVLVRLQATALNRADLLQRKGQYPPPPGASEILGLEASGTVEAVGAAVAEWSVGDAVCALLSGGGYATHAVVAANHLMPIPPGYTFEEAAAIPEAFLTAFQALTWLSNLQSDETVLVHAGASGVGTAAIQLAHARGARPIITASASKHDLCYALGAVAAIDYQHEDFAQRVTDLTDGHGADVILDFIGGPYFSRNMECLARDGRLVVLGLMGGGKTEGVHLGQLLRKRAQVIGSTLRNRSAAYKSGLIAAFRKDAWPLFGEGRLQPVLDRVYPWTEVVTAHQRMEANRNAGKIILRIADTSHDS